MYKISVIVPMYNSKKTIERCLDSIISSKYELYEIIVIDDGSTDESVSIVNNYIKENKRITLYKQTQDLRKPEIRVWSLQQVISLLLWIVMIM